LSIRDGEGGMSAGRLRYASFQTRRRDVAAQPPGRGAKRLLSDRCLKKRKFITPLRRRDTLPSWPAGNLRPVLRAGKPLCYISFWNKGFGAPVERQKRLRHRRAPLFGFTNKRFKTKVKGVKRCLDV
jgi:hypothetical protein